MTKLQIDLLVWLQERARNEERMLGNVSISRYLGGSPGAVAAALRDLEQAGHIQIKRIVTPAGYTVRRVIIPSTGAITGWSLPVESEPAAIPPDQGRYIPPQAPPWLGFDPHEELGRRLGARRYGRGA